MNVTQEFINHMFLATKYLQWIGKRATEKQVLTLMRQLDYETLKAMCEQRGIA